MPLMSPAGPFVRSSTWRLVELIIVSATVLLTLPSAKSEDLNSRYREQLLNEPLIDRAHIELGTHGGFMSDALRQLPTESGPLGLFAIDRSVLSPLGPMLTGATSTGGYRQQRPIFRPLGAQERDR
jgi:hypothetical protein